MTQAVRAIFVDLDGTLLNKEHLISDYTAAVLRKLKEQHKGNVCFTVATGRPFHYVLEQIKRCNLSVDYIISSNGCRIHSGTDFSVVQSHNIPQPTVERLFHVNVERQNKATKEATEALVQDGGSEAISGDVSKVRTMSTNVFCGTQWYTNYLIKGLGTSYPPHMQPSLLPADVLECLRTTNPLSPTSAGGGDAAAAAAARQKLGTFFGDVHMLFFYGPHANLVPAAEILRTDEHLKKEVSWAFSCPHIIDVYPYGIDKSAAVREVLQLVGVDAKDAAAFGDGQNDITMLRMVGQGFVMENGQAEVKAAVPQAQVVGSNAEDGVARKLVELFNLQGVA